MKNIKSLFSLTKSFIYLKSYKCHTIIRSMSSIQKTNINSISKSILSILSKPSFQGDYSWKNLCEIIKYNPTRLIVLDDTIFGCQGLYNIDILIDYSIETIKKQLQKNELVFCVITNTRYMNINESKETIKKIMDNIRIAMKEVNYSSPIQFIIRSDTTLRGNFLQHSHIVKHQLQQFEVEQPDLTIIAPSFISKGFLTWNDIHYVTNYKDNKDYMIPIGQTHYSKHIDKESQYESSNLIDYIIEKSNGKISRNKIISIPLNVIREEGPVGISTKLGNASQGSFIIINAISEEDMNIFLLGCLLAEDDGSVFLYNTSSSFIASRCGLEKQSLINGLKFSNELMTSNIKKQYNHGGIVIKSNLLSSHELNACFDMEVIEINSSCNIIEAKEKMMKILSYNNCLIIPSQDYSSNATLSDYYQLVSILLRDLETVPRFVLCCSIATSNSSLQEVKVDLVTLLSTKSFHSTHALMLGELDENTIVWILNAKKTTSSKTPPTSSNWSFFSTETSQKQHNLSENSHLLVDGYIDMTKLNANTNGNGNAYDNGNGNSNGNGNTISTNTNTSEEIAMIVFPEEEFASDEWFRVCQKLGICRVKETLLEDSLVRLSLQEYIANSKLNHKIIPSIEINSFDQLAIVFKKMNAPIKPIIIEFHRDLIALFGLQQLVQMISILEPKDMLFYYKFQISNMNELQVLIQWNKVDGITLCLDDITNTSMSSDITDVCHKQGIYIDVLGNSNQDFEKLINSSSFGVSSKFGDFEKNLNRSDPTTLALSLEDMKTMLKYPTKDISSIVILKLQLREALPDEYFVDMTSYLELVTMLTNKNIPSNDIKVSK